MDNFYGELIGTALLILLGNGVVANAILKGTKGANSGWIVITFGWGMAVFVAVLVTGPFSDAHINPAVTIGLAAAGRFDWSLVPMYLTAQMLGACIGAFLVWLIYKQHLDITENPDNQLGCFATGPAIHGTFMNLVSEIVGTAVLIYAVLHITAPEGGLGSLDALPVALVVLSIGLSLGGTTGYAINPARDLGPRIMHALLPMRGKKDSDWGYSWIPVVGPILGALAAVGLLKATI